MNLKIQSGELLRAYSPSPAEEMHGLVVTFYLGMSDTTPIDFAYLAPVSWKNRMMAKDRFESVLRSGGRHVIGSVLLGVKDCDVPDNSDDAVDLIHRMVPSDAPQKMLDNAIRTMGCH